MAFAAFIPFSSAWALVELTAIPREAFTQAEKFDAADPVELWEIEGSIRVRNKGLVAEEGVNSFKLDIEFNSDGRCLWRIPWAVPLEGDMKQTIRWRTGRHNDAALVGVGYCVIFIPTDTWYRRYGDSVRGGGATGWRTYEEEFGVPGWWDDSIVSESRGGPLSLQVAAQVDKFDLGAMMDPLIWIEGKAGQRAVLYLDDLRLEGDAPDADVYRREVQKRYDVRAAPFYRQMREWKERFEAVRAGLQAIDSVPDHVRPSRDALEKALAHRQVKLEGMIDFGHADWQDLDPVMDTLWAAEKSVTSLQSAGASPELVHYAVRPISNTTLVPSEIPATGAIGADLEAAACRGEYEPVCFALHAVKDLENLTVEVSDLEGPGIIHSDAVEPFILKVWYRSGFYSGDPNGRWLLKEMLLKDDALVTVDTEARHNYVRHTPESGPEEYRLCSGPTSENLAGLRPVDAETLQPVTLPAGTTKSFWLTVLVPDDAKSGNYEGAVTLAWSGGKSHRIPFRLKVHPFELPPSPLTYSVYHRGRVELGADPNVINSEDLTKDRYEREIRNIVEHGVLHPNMYDTLKMAPQALAIRKQAGVATDRVFVLDFWRTGLMAEAAGISRRDPNRAPEWHGHVAPGRRENAPMEEIRIRIGEWKEALREAGFGELYVMGQDEARGHLLKAERPVFKVVHEEGAKIWAAQTHETTFGIISDLMDVAVMAGIAKTFESERWHAVGKEVFQYGGPMTEWDHPENYRRNQGLVLWKNGYDGMMHYAYRHGFAHVWNDFDHERRDHSFVYPVVDGLIDTIAWEGMREGIDDTRYIAALLEAIDEASDRELAAAARAYLREMNLAAIMDEVRSEIVKWILQLRA